MRTLNCKGSLIDLSTPKVMGIINLTPDSFYDGGKTQHLKQILKQAEEMLAEGATFLDVGGYSSRPGAEHISEEEELKRLIPAIESISQEFPEAFISTDTFRSQIAKKVIEMGVALINDISAGSLDPMMMATVSKYNVPYIMMHLRGDPKTMAGLAKYKNVTTEVINELSEKLAFARAAGINDIIVDPGFGFAKTIAQSFELLNNLELFKILDLPILVGISRKSFVYKTLKISVEDGLNGTTALNTIALLKGASILRVHDVKEAMECIKLIENLNS